MALTSNHPHQFDHDGQEIIKYHVVGVLKSIATSSLRHCLPNLARELAISTIAYIINYFLIRTAKLIKSAK